MSFFLVLSIFFFGVMIASVVFFMKARAAEAQQQLPPGYGDQGGGFTPAGRQLTQSQGPQGLMNLRINDIVSYFGADYIVEGRLNYWQDGYTWTTYMLTDSPNVKWLAVEEDDELEVSLWEEVEDLRLSEPMPEFVEYRGQRYRMTERGEARVNQEGRTKNKTGLGMTYWQYEADDDTMLSVEKWASDIEISIGRELRPESLDVLPGDNVEY